MKVEEKHFYHGAAVMQIAEDEHFTAINPLRLNGTICHNGFLVNENIAVYFKYAGKPNGNHYQFNFKQESIEELKRIKEQHPHLFIALVCVQDREICGLTYEKFSKLHQRRRKNAGHDEDQLVVLAQLPEGKKFRVYVNAAGTKNTHLGRQFLVARMGFPGMLFNQPNTSQPNTSRLVELLRRQQSRSAQ